MRFDGKAALVTGASRGIGRAIAQAFAKRGARVALHYRRDRAAAEATLASLAGGGHVIVQADIADPEAVERMVKTVIAALGRIDILVNNAGIYTELPLSEASYEDWVAYFPRIMSVNLYGAANAMFCVARHMMRQGGGRIVNISSRGAFRGEPDAPAYGASKAGLNSLSQSLAKALAPHNIFVAAVAPGFVETDMAAERLAQPDGDEIRRQSPLHRVAKSEEVAHVAVFLASEGAEFTTGAIVDVNGASYLRS